MHDRHGQFLDLFLRHQAAIEAFVHTVVRDRVAADDIAQETATTLWAEFDRYDQARPFGPWARGVAANLVMRHFRQRQRGVTILSPEAVEAVLEASNRAPVEPSLRQRALQQCLDGLPDKSRTLVRLRFAAGMTFEEAAARVGSTGDAVRKAVARLREALRDCIEKRMAHLAQEQ